MFFFFTGLLDGDFKNAIRDFQIDEKMAKALHKADWQRQEFLRRFPLRALGHLNQEHFLSQTGNPNDFCHWITDKTNAVAGGLPWSKIRLFGYQSGARSWRNQSQPSMRERLRVDGEYYRHAIIRPLLAFLKSHGEDAVERVEHEFGQPLALKLLALYYPDEFICITRVGWLDRIIWAFRLDSGRTVEEKSRVVSRFYEDASQCARRLPQLAFVQLLDEYLGLGNWNGKGFVEFLVRQNGLSESQAVRYDRLARSVSLYLVRRKALTRSLVCENSIQLLHELRDKYLYTDDFAEAQRDRTSECMIAYDYLIEFKRWLEEERRIVDRKRMPRKIERKPEPEDVKDCVGRLKKSGTVKGLVDVLCDSGRERPFCHHYTSLSALLAMMEGGSLRLTRGDDPAMNDQLEWKYFGDMGLWRRTFIASFSCVKEESAAMWGLYGKPPNEAVRLSFSNKVLNGWMEHLAKDENAPEIEFSARPGEECRRKKISRESMDVSFGDVLYAAIGEDGKAGKYTYRGVDIPAGEFRALHPKGIDITKSPEITGFVKRSEWAYEEESRIVCKLHESLDQREGLGDLDKVKYVYLPLPKEVLASVFYVLGPCIPERLYEMVDSKIKSLVPGAQISKSKYFGNLKFKP